MVYLLFLSAVIIKKLIHKIKMEFSKGWRADVRLVPNLGKKLPILLKKKQPKTGATSGTRRRSGVATAFSVVAALGRRAVLGLLRLCMLNPP